MKYIIVIVVGATSIALTDSVLDMPKILLWKFVIHQTITMRIGVALWKSIE